MESKRKGLRGLGDQTSQEVKRMYHKDRDYIFEAQKKRVFQAFEESPKSMLQVAMEVNVLRSNITWYLREWRLQDKIQRVKTGFCPITGMKVGFYSTNPTYWKGGKP